VLSLNLEASAKRRRRQAVGPCAPKVSPFETAGLARQGPKRFRCSKRKQPESVADVDFTTLRRPSRSPAISMITKSRFEQAYRFNAEDTLVFRLAVTNQSRHPTDLSAGQFLRWRAGSRLYPQVPQ